MCSHLLKTDRLSACKRLSEPDEHVESTRAVLLLWWMLVFGRWHLGVERDEDKSTADCAGASWVGGGGKDLSGDQVWQSVRRNTRSQHSSCLHVQVWTA